MDEWTTCSDCGYSCLKSQLAKTKNKCPRCNKDEESKFLKRKEHFAKGGKKADMPIDIA